MIKQQSKKNLKSGYGKENACKLCLSVAWFYFFEKYVSKPSSLCMLETLLQVYISQGSFFLERHFHSSGYLQGDNHSLFCHYENHCLPRLSAYLMRLQICHKLCVYYVKNCPWYFIKHSIFTTKRQNCTLAPVKKIKF